MIAQRSSRLRHERWPSAPVITRSLARSTASM